MAVLAPDFALDFALDFSNDAAYRENQAIRVDRTISINFRKRGSDSR
jgi:hypothetical protein